MTDQLLGVFKVCLLVLLYLFFARVLWAVWSEVRTTKPRVTDARAGVPPAAIPVSRPHADPTAAGAAPMAGGVPHATAGRGPRGGRSSHPVRRFVVIEPRARKGAAVPVGPELTIGRAPGCTVSIPDDTFLSQLHARIYEQGPEVYVEDLGSTNGSFLNGNRLNVPMPVRKGDRLQIGATVLEAE
jgi:FHA domain